MTLNIWFTTCSPPQPFFLFTFSLRKQSIHSHTIVIIPNKKMNLRKKEDIYKSNKQQQQQQKLNSIEQCVIITRLVTYFILFVCITIRFCSTSFHVPNQLQMNSCLFFSESIISIRIYCRQLFFFSLPLALSLSLYSHIKSKISLRRTLSKYSKFRFAKKSEKLNGKKTCWIMHVITSRKQTRWRKKYIYKINRF